MLESDPPDLDVSSLLMLLGDAVSGAVLRSLDGSGLRHSHGYLIQRLIAGPTTATEIAADLGITQQAVSKSVKELVGLGLVEFAPEPPDRRRRPLQLTPQGRQAVDTSREARRQIDRRIRESLGGRDFERTRSALLAALDALDLSEHVRRRTVPPPRPALD